MKNKTKKTVRFVALDALERVQKGGAYSNLLLRDAINKGQLNEKDSRLLTELVYGTISHQLLLSFYLQPFIAKAKKVDDWVKLLLQLSLYQLLYLDKVPSHAVLNEAVEIAKVRGNVGIGKFVNGVLRNVQRQDVPELTTIKDPMKRLATEISMPQWLVEKLVKEIGVEETRQLGLSLFETSHVSCRVDSRKMTRQEAIQVLIDEGIEARESSVSPEGIIAEKGFIAGSRLFKEGILTVQDESSMLVAPALQIEPHHQVLDACAAPGGKTTHIATFLDKKAGGQVTSLDIHRHKVALIEENAERLHVSDVVCALELDARQAADEFSTNTFDRILVDAPCSGLGLMRRKPDIKYNKKQADFDKLPEIQLAILESVAPTLKTDGLLVYSTCTFAPEENQAVVARFLQAHPEFTLVDIPVSDVLQPSIENKMLTIYPHQYMTDGFFISCLRKK
ncbi:16S rRNA (cytosine(967)-C(5))-methyltransferase RsmB [Enterococcus saccharolyticus]|uniref:16S rRNA (cytosine(967)-C(5))-methyltransferase n=1 Tax=Enterococcus saccharolyticus subsp. saccharolyticus ATCC 43076 TaxID=1139996 RepID=S0JG16_9ENTE|nr:16S rRNA (cytosine(967)-C(5))-methyltransferase RsmB [Enterococcus saccharolyticus]EOT25911.1 ribosomal RNA small subunit methyltransferase B [Enterococcus saccharolyticus subsp. saccharolyticus ATCC 43076]EOT82721.1 ribosomal RNA small subunit methyltransferase B [Enterococcus saccharolyticus subsp. saccharolyticus ATCC 43076]OJG91086.1 ribosomal RNA small subunit methyltransferase B [Enterococcus saccharolyticus]